MKEIYKKKLSYFETKSKKWILSKEIRSILVSLQNGTGCPTNFVLTQV